MSHRGRSRVPPPAAPGTDEAGDTLPRRGFLRAGVGLTAATVAGAGLAGCGAHRAASPAAGPSGGPPPGQEEASAGVGDTGQEPRIRARRPLGRTGFEVSDIALGCGGLSEPAVARYAFDRGINFFDTAERYGNGASEKAIGGAMKHLDRKKLFLVTKLKLDSDESEEEVRRRLGRCLERLGTGHVDALYMHSVTDRAMIEHAGFHAAVTRLKAEGKVRFAGISSHGPRDSGGDSMEEVLLAAVEDGRFDLMLLAYSFLNRDGAEKVLAACKEKKVGATLMKVAPAALKPLAFDPRDPAPEHQRGIRVLMGRGMTREQAVAHLEKRLAATRAGLDRQRPAIDAFIEQHGIKSQDELDARAVQWVLGNPGASSVCVSMADFDTVDRYVPLSGTTLGARGKAFVRRYARAFSAAYCRHGCTACTAACPHGVPVATVMRYAYYFAHHRRQKQAMQKYLALGAGNAAPCLTCDAPCAALCPHGVPAQAHLAAAHDLLSLA